MKPEYVQYPRYKQADISLSLIGDAWDYIKNNMGAYVGFAAIVLIAGTGLSMIVQGPGQFQSDPTDPYAQFARPTYWIGQFVSMFFQYLYIAGTTRMALKELRGERAELSDGFKVFGQGLGAVLLAALMIAIATSIGTVMCIVPGVILSVLLMVTFPAILDQRLSAFDGMAWSLSHMKKHFWIGLGLLLVGGLVSGLGVCLCCVGVFFTIPIYPLVITMIYHQLRWEETEGMAAPQGWTPEGGTAGTPDQELPRPESVSDAGAESNGSSLPPSDPMT